jgi:hypothetical protein
MVKRAFGVIVAAPFGAFGLMYLMKAVKQETSMTQNFVGGMRKMSESLMGNKVNYARSSEKVYVPDAEVSSDDLKKESENLRNLYDGIKEENKQAVNQQINKIREINKRITPADQPRVKNSSPFFKNQQAKRFGIDGATKKLSFKDMVAAKKEENVTNS